MESQKIDILMLQGGRFTIFSPHIYIVIDIMILIDYM